MEQVPVLLVQPRMLPLLLASYLLVIPTLKDVTASPQNLVASQSAPAMPPTGETGPVEPVIPQGILDSDCYDDTFCIDSESFDDRVDLFVRSLVDWDITMVLDVETSNLVSDRSLPLVDSFKGRSVTKAVTLSMKSPEAGWKFAFSIRWILGDFRAEHQRGLAYELPYSEGKEFLVGQGYLGNVTHQGKYAIDWDMPVGTLVRAARGGHVIDLEEGFSEGRPDPDLKTKANFIKIRHPDGTIGNYVHLDQGGVHVQVGDRVERGQPIGLSGNTGFTTGPHLHFEVYSATRELGRRTIPIEFNTSERGAVQLREGSFYSR